MTLTVLFVDGKETINPIFLRCVYVKSFSEQFQTTLNTGSSNARTVKLNENFVLFGHDSKIKSDSTFDLIILRAKFYIYTCKINRNIPQLDHGFALHCLIDVYLKRKKLFCAFIDYKKAFVSVQRGLLWGKLLNSGVNGKVLCVIRAMYAKAKSCVKTRHGLSQFFVSNVGQ